MQSVPNHRADKTKDVSDHGRDHDKGNRSHWIEWFNEVNLVNHVRPENEIEDRLRSQAERKPTKRNATRRSMRRSPGQPVGISHCYSL